MANRGRKYVNNRSLHFPNGKVWKQKTDASSPSYRKITFQQIKNPIVLCLNCTYNKNSIFMCCASLLLPMCNMICKIPIKRNKLENWWWSQTTQSAENSYQNRSNQTPRILMRVCLCFCVFVADVNFIFNCCSCWFTHELNQWNFVSVNSCGDLIWYLSTL